MKHVIFFGGEAMKGPNDSQTRVPNRTFFGLCAVGVILGALWFNQAIRLSSQQLASDADSGGVSL